MKKQKPIIINDNDLVINFNNKNIIIKNAQIIKIAMQDEDFDNDIPKFGTISIMKNLLAKIDLGIIGNSISFEDALTHKELKFEQVFCKGCGSPLNRDNSCNYCGARKI